MSVTQSLDSSRYYECEILTYGSIKVGWQLVEASADHEIGGDAHSWAYDGHNEDKIHSAIAETYGKVWHPGDILGVFLDLTDRTISKLLIKVFIIFL